MMRAKVCSICGMTTDKMVAPKPRKEYDSLHAYFEAAREVEKSHERIECGTWDQLLGEVQRLHNLHPDEMETAIRMLIRSVDKGVAWLRAYGKETDVSVPSGERDHA